MERLKAMKYRVHFENVGRYGKAWIQDLNEPCESALLKSVNKHGGLHSREVEIDMAESEIIVGGYRVVGRFRIEKLFEQKSLSA